MPSLECDCKIKFSLCMVKNPLEKKTYEDLAWVKHRSVSILSKFKLIDDFLFTS